MLLMAAAFMPAIARSVDLGKLPSPEVITKHLSPIVSSQRYDRNGYVAESLGPITLDQAAISLAILSVPAEAAQRLADQMVSCGILGILNFAPVPLSVPPTVNVLAVDLSVQLEHLAYKVQSVQGGIFHAN